MLNGVRKVQRILKKSTKNSSGKSKIWKVRCSIRKKTGMRDSEKKKKNKAPSSLL